MQVHVTLYGALRVAAGRQAIDLSFDAPSITMIQLLNALVVIHPRIRPYLLAKSAENLHPDIRILINGTRAKPDLTLSRSLYDHDRVTFLAPIVGGNIRSPLNL